MSLLNVEFRVLSFGFKVAGFGFRVLGFGIRVLSFGSRISDFGFSGFGFRGSGFLLRKGVGLRVERHHSFASQLNFEFRGSGFRFTAALEATQGQMDDFPIHMPLRRGGICGRLT